MQQQQQQFPTINKIFIVYSSLQQEKVKKSTIVETLLSQMMISCHTFFVIYTYHFCNTKVIVWSRFLVQLHKKIMVNFEYQPAT